MMAVDWVDLEFMLERDFWRKKMEFVEKKLKQFNVLFSC